MIRSAAQRFTFVEVAETLWSSKRGLPGAEILDESSRPGSGQRSEEYRGKLRGMFTFPFSLTLPASVTISDHGPKETYYIPSTFKDRAVSVNYKLVATVTRGRFTAEHLYAFPAFFFRRLRGAAEGRMLTPVHG